MNTDIYPLTIVKDRFDCLYSKGKYTAWNCNPNNVPEDIYTRDDAFYFWNDIYSQNSDIIDDVPTFGVGDTVDEAINNLLNKIKKIGYTTEIQNDSSNNSVMSQLNCPCYKCSSWRNDWGRCKDYIRSMDCITWSNWNSTTFKN